MGPTRVITNLNYLVLLSLQLHQNRTPTGGSFIRTVRMFGLYGDTKIGIFDLQNCVLLPNSSFCAFNTVELRLISKTCNTKQQQCKVKCLNEQVKCEYTLTSKRV